jgi:hypothetical protein
MDTDLNGDTRSPACVVFPPAISRMVLRHRSRTTRQDTEKREPHWAVKITSSFLQLLDKPATDIITGWERFNTRAAMALRSQH